jgi:hypothetical protein
MKKKFLLLVFSSLCLFGCLNTEEHTTINADGSGIYKSSVDMSGLFDMIEMAAMMDTSSNNPLKNISDKVIDSVVTFKSFIDTVTSLTADQKKLFKDATMRIKINEKEKAFNFTMTYPFAKMDDLQKLIELQKSDKLPNPLKESMAGEMPATTGGSLPSIDKIMNVRFKKGLIERKIDQEKLNDLMNDEQFKEVGKVEEMLEAITFSSSFHLPKAAKNTTGEKLKLSDDKKTATISYTLLDMVKAPSSLEFKVEY